MRARPILASIAVATAACAPARAHAAPIDRTMWLERVERGRQDYRAFIEKASIAHASALEARKGAPRADAGNADKTLRDGDIVVDGDRLIVFRSRRLGVPYAGEFVPLDPAAARNHAAELQDIARALRNR